MLNRCAVLGAGGHARVATECLEDSLYNIMAYFVDDAQPGESCRGVQALNMNNLKQFCINNQVSFAFPAIGDNEMRKAWFEEIKDCGLYCATGMSQDASISPRAKIAPGCVIMPGAVIEPDVVIGEGCIINSTASIGHDTKIGAFTHIAPGASIGGECQIGEGVLIGINCAVNRGLKVGANRILPSGKTLITSMPDDFRPERKGK